ncbi:MAG TPA: class A beta-lactamase [Xanthobacteraceae bacterium]|nr:class A beta-lactamase [Xanthobacteraceae bacterium]
MISRRRFGAGCLSAWGLAAGNRLGVACAAPSFGNLVPELARLERESGGCLGVAAIDTASGAVAGQRANERFPMCSTFKVLACGAILAHVDAGKEDLDRRIRFGTGDLLEYSPVTKERTGGEGMTLAELCAAAMTYSDNTAANLLLARLGGPQAITRFARSLGDGVTRLDRTEPTLNQALLGDPRDTTAPAAMARDLKTLVLGSTLSSSSRKQLAAWLLGNKTGGARLRAGLPEDWRVGDKTGSGERGTANDVGVVWPPGRAPLVVAVYLTQASVSPDRRNATIAAVGRAVASALG